MIVVAIDRRVSNDDDEYVISLAKLESLARKDILHLCRDRDGRIVRPKMISFADNNSPLVAYCMCVLTPF